MKPVNVNELECLGESYKSNGNFFIITKCIVCGRPKISEVTRKKGGMVYYPRCRYCAYHDEERNRITSGNLIKLGVHITQTEEWQKEHSRVMKAHFADSDYKARMLKSNRRCLSPATENIRRGKISISTKRRWQDPEYKTRVVKAILKGSSKRPTRPESIMNRLLQKYYPNQWVYNGDFSQGVMIHGLVPDFVNTDGKKQVIEVFGEYYHNPEKRKGLKYIRTEKGRIEKYNGLGFNCLVIWESELGKWRAVLRKIKQFAEVSNG